MKFAVPVKVTEKKTGLVNVTEKRTGPVKVTEKEENQ